MNVNCIELMLVRKTSTEFKATSTAESLKNPPDDDGGIVKSGTDVNPVSWISNDQILFWALISISTILLSMSMDTKNSEMHESKDTNEYEFTSPLNAE